MIAHMLTHEPEEAVQLLRLTVDERVREGARRGHKGCLCFQQRSDLRNVPSGCSRELPTANNALNVSSGWLAQTPLALLQGPGSSKMMEHREPYTSEVPRRPSQKDGGAEGRARSQKFFKPPSSLSSEQRQTSLEVLQQHSHHYQTLSARQDFQQDFEEETNPIGLKNS